MEYQTQEEIEREMHEQTDPENVLGDRWARLRRREERTKRHNRQVSSAWRRLCALATTQWLIGQADVDALFEAVVAGTFHDASEYGSQTPDFFAEGGKLVIRTHFKTLTATPQTRDEVVRFLARADRMIERKQERIRHTA